MHLNGKEFLQLIFFVFSKSFSGVISESLKITVAGQKNARAIFKG